MHLIVQEYGNVGLKTSCFRAGCIIDLTFVGLHGFLSYSKIFCNQENTLIDTKANKPEIIFIVTIWLSVFGNFIKFCSGEVFNTGGGRFSNCSIIEALNIVENFTGVKIKKKIIKQNRIGDHIWYVSSMRKFRKFYPNWKQKFSTNKIIKELVDQFSA